MKLIKVKGVIIKEVPYKDNDKILTVMTDNLGKISCIAKGARKTNSALLAPCQLLVYSEFVLYKGTSFYHINSAETINTFYKLRTDLDKIEQAYEIAKVLNFMTYEEESTEEILSLFLNTLFVIQNKDMDSKLVESIFKLKLLSLIGYAPDLVRCSRCDNGVFDTENLCDNYLYNLSTNSVLCSKCSNSLKTENEYIKLPQSVYIALLFCISSSTKKVFNFVLKDSAKSKFINFVSTYYTAQLL